MRGSRGSRPHGRRRRGGAYLALTLVVALVAVGVTLLVRSVTERKPPAKTQRATTVALSEDAVDPMEWGKSFPSQYDGYRRAVDKERTRFGGSDAFARLDADSRLRRIYSGYAVEMDPHEERGHAYSLRDLDEAAQIQQPQSGACLHCHGSILPAYRKLGAGDVMKGFEASCALPWEEARKGVTHPVACIDCHDPKTQMIRVTRPAFIRGIAALKKKQGIPNYDPNRDASRQEMRSFVCGQCHVDYFLERRDKVVTYPWVKGVGVDDIEAYYDSIGFIDWTHRETGAPMLKAHHPQFEMWSQSLHAQSGVACADCHMPQVREGTTQITDHRLQSPLLDLDRACRACHAISAQEMRGRIDVIQKRNAGLMDRAQNALIAQFDAMKTARDRGATDAQLLPTFRLQRRAQFRTDFVDAEGSVGFHAPQETARILGEAIDYARQGQVAALLLAAHGGPGGEERRLEQRRSEPPRRVVRKTAKRRRR